ncbi:MAG: phosphoribosylamine--glycine ligase [Myxococcota bacterium]
MSRTFLVVGSGGREHAMAWKLAQADDEPTVWVAPGNDGIAEDEEIQGGCVDFSEGDFEGLADFAEEHDVTLTVVGPEAPLCDGIVDYFEERDLPIFGPRAAAAELEGSKAFAKDVMNAAGVPTAQFKVFERLGPAMEYLMDAEHPVVIKADGLAGGKGVVISEHLKTSEETLREYMEDEKFGEASQTVLIEECLVGTELSFMVVTDGTTIVPLSTSQDHKRVGEGDEGPNTGGMGAFTPSHRASSELRATVLDQVIQPTIAELKRRDIDYSGFLYAGLMLTAQGPKVLEFNCRLGDPETQPLLYAMDADLGDVLARAAAGQLGPRDQLETDNAACCIVLASEGYPGPRDTGHVIQGLDRAADVPNTKIFHAGTALEDGEFINAGGRVLGVTARGDDVAAARDLAYQAVSKISWPGMHYRGDIGEDIG